MRAKTAKKPIPDDSPTLFDIAAYEQQPRYPHPDDADVAGDDDSVSLPIPGADTESFPIRPQSHDSVSPLIYGKILKPNAQADINDDSVSPPGNQRNDSVSSIEDDTESPYNWTIHQGDRKYQPKGTARGKNNYFRFSYRDRGKMRHVHIPGGNTSSRLAQQRWEEIRQMVQEGKSPHYIVAVIKSWS